MGNATKNKGKRGWAKQWEQARSRANARRAFAGVAIPLKAISIAF